MQNWKILLESVLNKSSNVVGHVMVFYSPDWTNIWYSFILLTVNLFVTLLLSSTDFNLSISIQFHSILANLDVCQTFEPIRDMDWQRSRTYVLMFVHSSLKSGVSNSGFNKIRKAFSKFYHRRSKLIVKYIIGLKTLLQHGISVLIF